MKKKSEKLSILNKNKNKILKEKIKIKKEYDINDTKIKEGNKALQDLIALKIKATKIETFNSNSKESLSMKKFISEINIAITQLNNIGVISLSNEIWSTNIQVIDSIDIQ
jgi:hypothetical protein